ncbi:MAG: NuoI/complex I 23 kDa subunit family protein [bacterium]
MAKAQMTFVERLYLPEIAKGLVLTSRHFFVNMWRHTLASLKLGSRDRAMVTISYPEVRRPYPLVARSRHRLTQREDGSAKCVACMMCATACPADCILIEAEEHPDPSIEKRPRHFDIDMSKCVYCGFCVEACPEDAIRMDTGDFELAYFDRKGLIYDMDFLLNKDPYAVPPNAEPLRHPGGKP